ncbi:MAG: ABC transporter ATP-binding protein [Clostridiales Family XIII bacterium]|jgi:branched-chain amino acid transport system ATP-binding protein|nr:ABC transporter ATP-binding protein [Clostridiales Family XIII bacterium]
MLEIINLTKRFGGLEALSGLNATVEEGELLGLIGPNGSGKTTLFNCVSGVLPPTEGRIRFMGEDVTGRKPWETARRGIARSYQIVRPFANMTVLENVMAGAFCRESRYSEAQKAAEGILETLGLSEKAPLLAKSLNLGERKKLEIGKALATKPRLLLLDEVMAGLNPSEVAEMAEIVRGLNRGGITVVMIEHIMEAITSLCERLIALNFGKLIKEGPTRQVIRDPSVAEAYFGKGN